MEEEGEYKAISYDTCWKDFKQALVAVGENAKLYGEHSDRIGGLSAAANADVPWEDTTAHTQERAVLKYG